MSITPLPTPPSRQDPVNFAARGDTFMAALPAFVTETNAAVADVNSQQVSATNSANTAVAKAAEASAARDIAMAAVNYKGDWASLSGPLAIPASVFHSGKFWMLASNVANVALVTPGVSGVWIDVTPASGLGSAAYSDASDFQPSIGSLVGLLIANGSGGISAASADQIVSAIGAMAVQNATHAGTAGSASAAESIVDGAVSAASKVANGILTWAKMAAMSNGRLIGRSTSGSGSPEEISIGTNLSLVNRVLSCTFSPSIGGAVYDTPGSYSWTVPAGVTSCRVLVIGGGGAGGGGNSSGNYVSCGGGGGAGGAGVANINGLTPGQVITITVGAGGVGVSGGTGGSGGTSSFGNYASATGGGAGTMVENGLGAGGSGGSPTGCFWIYPGRAGDSGTSAGGGNGGSANISSIPYISLTGVVGEGAVRIGYAGPSSVNHGGAATKVGCGGGGGSEYAWGGASGGNGKSGLVVLEW